MFKRPIQATLVALIAAAPLAAQPPAPDDNSAGQRWGDRLHQRNGRSVSRITTDRMRVSPSPSPATSFCPIRRAAIPP